MAMKKIMTSALLAIISLLVVLPGQAAMVGTAQLQQQTISVDLQGMPQKREWIHQQLLSAGVGASDASRRVGAMTDMQVAQIHQRIDQVPAGGNVILVILLALVITDVLGYTDIFPFIRPAD